MKNIYKIGMSALSLAAALSLTACSSSAATNTSASSSNGSSSSSVLHDANGDKKLVVYGIYKSGDQTWFLNEGKAAKAYVEKAGGTFNYVDVQTDPQKELDAINNAIANKADGIVTCTPDQTMSQNIVDLCKENNLSVVACDDALESAGKKLVPWVGISGKVIGESVGTWVCDYIKTNKLDTDSSTGLLMMTMNTVSSCVPRTDGESEIIYKTYPDYKTNGRMFTVDYDGTTDKGNTQSAAMFTGHPEIKKWIVFGANEEGVVGAVRALETAGLDKNSVAVGMGAYLAKDEYKKGSAMKAAPFFSDVAIGEGSVKALFDLIDKKDVQLENAVDAVMTTPDNYKDVMGSEAN